VRILFLAPTIRLGDTTGDAIHVSEEVTGLQAKGNRLMVLVGNRGELDPLAAGTDLYELEFERSYESFRDLARYAITALKALGLAVLLSRNFHPQAIYERHVFLDLGPFLSKLFRVPCVVELNGLASVERPGYDARLMRLSHFISWLECATLRRHSAYVCVTNQLANLVRSLPRSESAAKIIVTGNGADVRLFTPGNAPPADFGLPSGKYVVFVGHLVKWQGLDWMVRAMSDVVATIPSAHLLIIGMGPEMTNLKSLVHQLSLDNKVTFQGPVRHSDVPPFLRLASVCVSPATAESGGAGELKGSSPIKIFEYMAAGKPVILTRIGEISDVIDREHLGTVVEFGDTLALTAAVCKYLEGGGVAREDGMRGRDWVVENQSWERIVERIDKLLVSVRG